jgi:nicotinamidase-related amidase
MLNDFVREGAVLEVPQTRRIVPGLQNRLAEARRAEMPVVYVCDAHEANDREFERMGWPPHAVRGTEGAQVIVELAPAAGENIVCKTTYSGFAGTDLAVVLKRLGAEELILTGCVTNICVLYTAADAVMRGYRVRVPADLVANLDEADGEFALAQMEKVLGVRVER